ncbi:hypothetical protein [Rhizobium halophytocola]|uniref:Uncharacterized protein n=1 Tax=Rhizobium halophytocola TaxID=735519 RepID=A0ABS4E689_9HYPH|nr:hypothetical protein [Rhizobium halophytocola]MBP1853465.1 hypothetical protein [Rhizobium halophytocola]
MAQFDYMTGAGLYAGKTAKGAAGGPRYKRFDTVAEALRFAIEQMASNKLRGSILEVEEVRFDDTQIRRLYDAPEYPLARSSL